LRYVIFRRRFGIAMPKYLCLIFPAIFVIANAEEPILDESFAVQKVASGCKFTEGPTIAPDGALVFSDGPNDRIMRLGKDGKLTEFLKPSGAANGLLYGHDGRLLMCQSSREGGGRALARLEKNGEVTVLTAKHDGKRFIAPNDLCIDAEGRIYFTDPYYSGEKSQPTAGVYRFNPDGTQQLLVDNLLKPNGIVITPDSRTIYVSDRGTQKLHRYKVTEAGELESDGIVYDFSPDRGIDGMWLDIEGNIYGAAGEGETTGLFVISPEGKLLLHKPMPEFATNVTFGGEDMRDLYLTAMTSVYKMRTRIPGMRIPEKVIR
jgi:gluconolactonase